MAAGRSFEFNQAERGRCRPVRWRMGAEMGEEADVRRRGAAVAFARSPSSPAVFLDGAVFMHSPPSARAPTGAGFARFRIMADSCVLMRDGAI